MTQPCDACGWNHGHKLEQLACWSIWGLPNDRPGNVKDLLRGELRMASLSNPGWGAALGVVIDRGHARDAVHRSTWEHRPDLPALEDQRRSELRQWLSDHGLNPLRTVRFTVSDGVIHATILERTSVPRLIDAAGQWEAVTIMVPVQYPQP